MSRSPSLLCLLVTGGVAALSTVSHVYACGLRGADIPVGTPVQSATLRMGETPSMGFQAARTVVTRAEVLAAPCHGTLRKTRPLGFRYVPHRPGFVGRDTYAIRACNARGECSVTAAIVTFVP